MIYRSWGTLKGGIGPNYIESVNRPLVIHQIRDWLNAQGIALNGQGRLNGLYIISAP